MDLYTNASRLRRRQEIPLKFLLLLFISLIIGSILLIRFISTNPQLMSTLGFRPTISATPDKVNEAVPDVEPLGSVIQGELIGTKGTYGIAVKNLKTGETYYSDGDTSFDAASLYKLWVLATAYQEIDAGTLKKDQVLAEDVKVLNDRFKIASESAELTEGRVSLPVNEAIEKMIVLSDNYSALLLVAKVRLQTIATFLQRNGFTQSAVGTTGGAPKTTARDTAFFLEKLYKGQLADPVLTKEMIGVLKRQRLNSKIPKYLPVGTPIAHKTGELDGYTHDAGIVYTDKGDYIIVVLSLSNDRAAAAERISNVSSAVYEYFKSQ